jgi:hypothetical protein
MTMHKKTVTVTLFMLAALCIRPLPINADISFSTKVYQYPLSNPAPSAAVMDMVNRALYRLADDPKLAAHPIRRFVYDPFLQARIIFDNPGTGDGAKVVRHNEIHINSEGDFVYYLNTLVHEFIHIGMMEKYGDTLAYTFLPPADFAFLNLMEEAFANAINLWVHFNYPEMPSRRRIRYSGYYTRNTDRADAMRNDFRVRHPQLNEEQLTEMVIGQMFNFYMTEAGAYTLMEIPRNMSIAYGQKNTFLIPEYDAYRPYSDAILRYAWNYLSAMLPFQLPIQMTYDHYRNLFLSWTNYWAGFTRTRESDPSIAFWVQYDAPGAAQAKLVQGLPAADAKPKEMVYDYLLKEDELRLNRLIQEIDPGFIPVDTSRIRH